MLQHRTVRSICTVLCQSFQASLLHAVGAWAGSVVHVMGEPASCAWLRSVRPGFKLRMEKSTDFLQCLERIHMIFLTAVNDTNASCIQN